MNAMHGQPRQVNSFLSWSPIAVAGLTTRSNRALLAQKS
jgi:hypothetical protein